MISSSGRHLGFRSRDFRSHDFFQKYPTTNHNWPDAAVLNAHNVAVEHQTWEDSFGYLRMVPWPKHSVGSLHSGRLRSSCTVHRSGYMQSRPLQMLSWPCWRIPTPRTCKNMAVRSKQTCQGCWSCEWRISQSPRKHALMCQTRPRTGPMLAASDWKSPGSGTLRWVQSVNDVDPRRAINMKHRWIRYCSPE